ncbi:FecR domain-containing protein [Minwuia sp. IMCC3077]|uniref:FecR domain-containing protein n=1 Tax=Minwuia sp. IMCC3077 TaxID=3040676 RepID=UPI002479C564|nr:FecR domain-containing protein [Minwuia sp. IMCC3077]
MSKNEFPPLSGDGGATPEFVAVVDATGQTSLVIDQGLLLLTAQFVRSGPDLILVGKDGSRVLVINFFSTENPPDLYTLNGARIDGSLAELLSGPRATGLAQQGDGALGDPIGVIEQADGAVFVTRVNGTREQVQVGDPVFTDDVVETSEDGAAGIRFNDDTTFSIGGDARMVLDDFVYDPAANTGSAVVNVLQGSFSFVSGAVAKTGDDALTVKTPVLTIGVRGTFVGGKGAQEGEQSEVVNLPQEDGTTGRIFVSNAAGGVELNQAFEGTQTSSQFQAPAAPRIFSRTEIESKFGNALSNLPGTPQVGQSGNDNDSGGDRRGDDGGGAGGETEGEGEGDAEGEGDGEAAAEGEGEGEGDGEEEGEGDGEEEGDGADGEGEGDGGPDGGPGGDGGPEGEGGGEADGDGGPDGGPDGGADGDGGSEGDGGPDGDGADGEGGGEDGEGETGGGGGGGDAENVPDGGGATGGGATDGGTADGGPDGGGGSGGGGSDGGSGGEGGGTGAGTGTPGTGTGTPGTGTGTPGTGAAGTGGQTNDNFTNQQNNILGSTTPPAGGGTGGTTGGTQGGTDPQPNTNNNDDLVIVVDPNGFTGGGDNVTLGGGNDNVNAAAGNDTVDGGAGDDTIDGGAGSDRLFGGAGNDSLLGGAGNDTLTGVDGNDVVDGGDGTDAVDFSGTSNGVAANLVTGRAQSIGANEVDTDTLIAIEDITGGAGGDSLTGNGVANVLTGNAGNDTLVGNAGADNLVGGAGDDELNGGSGNDTLNGGTGTDRASFAGETSSVTVNLLTGTANGETSGTDSLTGIENVTGGDAGDQITGDTLGNALDGGAGNDSIFGGAGVDSLDGGAGSDSLDGGAGTDVISGGDGNDTLLGGADADSLSGDAGNDSLDGGTGINTLDGGAGDDTALGGAESDQINGGAGADSLLGAGGDDLIAGGDGNDTLTGGDGADFLSGDADLSGQTIFGDGHTPATVTVSIANDGGEGSVQFIFFTLSAETAITITTDGPTTDPEIFLFNDDGSLDAEDFLASDDDDGLPAGSFSNAIINTGDEIGNLPAGDYVLAVSDFSLDLDEAVAGINDEGGSLSEGDIAVTFQVTTGTIQVTTGGSAAVGIDPGNDLLIGGAGNDTLQGGDGDDSLSAGDGDDALIGGAGNDTIDGGAGTDAADFSDAAAALDVNLAAGTVTGDGNDLISSVETLVLSGASDTVTGAAAAELIFGGAGDDTMNSGDGNDTLSGDAGADTLFGAAGADQLFGGADDDFFDGGAGNDIIDGGAGTDTALFTYGGETGVVVNLTAGTATDEFGNTDQLAGIENVTGSDFSDQLTGDAQNNVLRGGIGNDTLLGAGGADTLDGGAGNDLLNLLADDTTTALGGDGNDIFAVNATVLGAEDVLDGGAGVDTLAIELGGTIDEAALSGVTNIETLLPTTDQAIDITLSDAMIGAEQTLFVNGSLLVSNTSTLVVNGSAEQEGNLSIQGGAADDELDGGQAADTLRGGDGTDTLQGNGGSDVIDGGADFDTASFADLNQAVNASLVTNTAVSGNDTDTLVAVEGLLGSAFNDTLTAGAGQAHDLVGGAGNDLLNAGDGTMFIDGGVGDDTVVVNNAALDANDVLKGGDGTDLLQVSGGGDIGGTALDSVTGFENVELLDDAETDLTLRNGQINNSGTIGINASALAAVTSALFIDAALKSDAAINVESGAADDVILGSQGNDVVQGNAGQDAIFGGVGDDTLSGGAGTDLLQGDAGADNLAGDAGQDLLAGGAGDDSLDGGADLDVADFSDAASGVTVDLGAGTATGADSGTDTLTNIEIVQGTAQADDISLADGIDGQAAVGGAGNDTLTGGDNASDALLGQLGDDLINAGSGNDNLEGGGGNDTLFGDAGADELQGDAGNDLLNGGAGDDTIEGDSVPDADLALTFDGIDDSAILPGFTGLSGTDDATFEAWLAPGAVQDMAVFDTREDPQGVETGLMFGFRSAQGEGLVAVARIAGNGQAFEVTSDLLAPGAGAAQHFAVTFDRDGLMSLFVNGVASGAPVNISALNGVDISTNTPLTLGESNIDDAFGRFQGTMDEARIWSIVRSEQEISGALDDLLVGDEAGLELYLDFDEEGFNFALDQTADSATAVLLGGVGRVEFTAVINDVTSGNDTLEGGDGSDILNGGDGIDAASFANDPNGVFAELVAFGATDGFGNFDTLSGIENLIGSAFDDTLQGGAGANTIEGGAGGDSLSGGQGNDSLDGGAGDDTLVGGIGGEGDDVLTGGDGTDTADFGGAVEAVNVNLVIGTANGGQALGNDTLSGIENVIATDFADNVVGDLADNLFQLNDGADIGDGGSGNDTLLGGGGNDDLAGDSGADILSGGAGDDTLAGDDGADSLDGGDGTDTADYIGDLAGVNVDLAAGTALDASESTDTLTGIENVEGSDFDDTLAGDVQANVLGGGDGADSISGAAGADTLFGDQGNDTLSGGDGDDSVAGGDGDDLFVADDGVDDLSGNAGSDTLAFTGATEGVVFDIAAQTLTNDGFGNTDTVFSIENAIGSTFADSFTLGLDAQVAGGAGDDLFTVNTGIGTGGVISDFTAGTGTEDVIDLSSFGFGNLAEVQAESSDDGTSTTIQLSATDSILLTDVLVADLADDDFIFGNNADQFPALLELGAATSDDGFLFGNATAEFGFGSAIAGIGDVSGDGLGDLLIGSPYGNGGAGEAFVLFGDAAPGFVQVQDGNLAGDGSGFGITATSVGPGEYAGRAVAAIGDVNGDGFTDFAVGGPGVYNGYYRGSGAIAVVFGDADGLSGDLDLDNLDGTNGFSFYSGYFGPEQLGASISGGGDLNGDGIDDLVVGAPGTNGSRGEILIVFGSTNGFVADFSSDDIGNTVAGTTVTGDTASAQFGYSVDIIGDFDGDGFDDLVVGEPFGSAGGKSYVIFGAANLTIDTTITNVLEGSARAIEITAGEFADRLGESVSAAGDLNNDGFDDLIIGASGTDAGLNNRGAAHVVFGSANPQNVDASQLAVDGLQGFSILGDTALERVGNSVDGGRDVNGDGIADIVVGAYDAAGTGEVIVIFGSSNGFASSIAPGVLDGTDGLVIRGGGGVTEIGGTVALVEDVNGDGFDDIAFSSSGGFVYNGGAAVYDSTFIIFGRDSSGEALVGGAGNDDLTGDENANLLVGAQGNDTLSGLVGNDVLRGGIGDDSAVGGDGDDLLDGGAGADTLIGGAGVDTLRPGSNDGSVGDFVQAGVDDNLIVFDAPGAGFFIVDYSDQVNGIVANIGAVEGTVTKIGGTDTLQGVNLIDGTVGGLQINGGSGADVFTANLQSNEEFIQIRGGAGNDTITGGAGFDRLDYVGAAAGVNVDISQGLTLDDGDGGVDTFSQIDEVRGSDNSDTLTGSENNDRFITRQGDDTVDGAGGFDLVRYDRSNIENVNVDLSANTATVQFVGALGTATDTLLNIESIRGSRTGNDTLTGDALANLLDGRGGNDLIDGGDGNDTLLGGDGDDTLLSGTNDGNGDLLNTGAGNDLVSFVNPGGGFFILDYTAETTGIVGNIGNTDGTIAKASGTDTLQGVDLIDGILGGLQVLGGTGDDVITVDLLDANEFFQFRGGAGNDTITGGGGFDRLDYVGAAGGVTIDIAAGVTTDDGDGGTDSFSQIDEFRGSDNADSFIGSAGDDRFITRRGNDTVDGGDGFDLVRYDRANIDFVDVDLSAEVANVRFTGNQFDTVDSLISIESIRGSRTGSDTIAGDANDNQLDGRGGDDILSGGLGDDTLIGRDGTDSIDGGDGFDIYVASDGTEGVIVDLTLGTVTNDGFGNVETVTGIELVVGSDQGDQFTFGSGTGFTGNAGDDLFIAVGRMGVGNFISDFTAGAATDDVVDVSEFGFLNFSSLLQVASDDGTDTTLQLGLSDSLVLQNVLVADLAADDFIFADAQPIDPLLDLRDDFDATSGFIFANPDTNEKFGQAIDGIGDINGDGLDDILVGASYGSTNAQLTGEAFVLFGDSTPQFVESAGDLDLGGRGFEPYQSEASSFSIFGYDVAGIGDLNGDGFRDFAISARNEYVRNSYGTGEVTVVFGSANGLTGDIDVSNLDGTDGFVIRANDYDIYALGYSIAGEGDFNGDGFDDLIIGAPASSYGQANAAGEIYVVFGGTDGFPAINNIGDLVGSGDAIVIDGQQTFARLGESVDFAGDFDGDGFDDIIAGAPDANYAGQAFVIFGSAAPASGTLDSLLVANGAIQIDGALAGDALGHAVSGAGDVNGDGLDDVIVGSPYNDAYADGAGAAFVIFGSAARTDVDTSIDLDGSNGFVIFGRSEGDNAGFSVDGGGDVNGDGLSDLIIGARNASYSGNYGLGEAYVVFGSDAGFAATLHPDAFDGLNGLLIRGPDTGTYTGHEVAIIGDVNGDGFDDVAVSSYYNPNGYNLYEGTFIVFGTDNTGAAQVGSDLTDTLLGDANANLLVGAQGDDVLNGFAGNDTLIGALGNDSLLGGDDDDLLRGGVGNDTLDGGAGNDTLLPGSNDGTGEVIITGTGDDLVSFDGAGLGFFNLDYSAETTGLVGNIGNTSGTVVKANGTDTLVDVDVIDGTVGGLLITGGTGNDSFTVDLIDQNEFVQFRGGQGNDTFIGGAGFDRLDYINAASGINLNIELGLTDGDGDGGVDTFSNVDEFRGSDNTDIMTGSTGNDRFITREGNDTVDGAGGFDLVRYDRASVEFVNVDLTAGTANVRQNGLDFVDFLSNIESIRGSLLGNDTISGTAESERFEGRGGNDILSGLAGNDTLFGGDGDDTIDAGAGFDLLDGGAGGNDLLIVDFSGTANGVNTQGTADDIVEATSLFQVGGTKTISGFERVSLTGSDGNDELVGGDLEDSLFGGLGNDTLNGGAGGSDSIVGGSGDDELLGARTATFDGGDGIDKLTINLAAATDNIVIDDQGTITSLVDGTEIRGIEVLNATLGSGNDSVDFSNTDASDIIDGGLGDDTINAGTNNDTLAGGAGIDLLIADFSGSVNSVVTQGTNDDITQATIINQVGDSKTVSGFEIASLTGGINNDELVGGAFDDTLIGNDGNDTLHGGSGGADQIDGGGGDDNMFGSATGTFDGGTGLDRLAGDFSSIAEDMVLAADDGTDIFADGTSITSIEALNATLGSGNDSVDFAGIDLSDTIDGGAGNDTINAGTNNDTLSGGAGIDLLIADFSGSVNSVVTQGTNDDITQATIINQIGDSKTVSGFEIVNLTGGISTDELVGGAFDDTLIGNGGNDTLHGGSGGADQIDGGDGDDNLFGSATGTFDGGAGTDRLAGDFSSISEDMVLAADDGTDVFADGTSITSIEALNATLGSGNDSVDFSTIDLSDTIDGGLGDDTINAGTNNDTLSGGDGIDLLIADFSGSVNSVVTQGTDNDITQATILNQIGDSKTISGFEFVSLTGGSGNDELVGGVLNDTLIGNAGNDTLHGGLGGFDSLFGGDGNDTLIGGDGDGVLNLGAGDDSVQGDAGNDTIDGGDGFDAVAYDNEAGILGVTVDLVAGTATDTFGDTDTLISIEHVVGGAANDDIFGSDADELLVGDGGDDVLEGSGGVDTLVGGTGSDEFAHASLLDITSVNANVTVAASGLSVDLIDDFSTGIDLLSFDETGGFQSIDQELTTFEVIGVDYDGTNSGAQGSAAYIFDGTHLIYDDDLAAEGYQVIANMNGGSVAANDITFFGGSLNPGEF